MSTEAECISPLLLPPPTTENFKLAAAAIVAAGSTFRLTHGSSTSSSTPSSTRRPISKSDIDSMPTQNTTKADLSALDSVVIENSWQPLASAAGGGSRPTTPHSQTGVEVISNHVAMEITSLEAASSQENSHGNLVEEGLNFELFVAKYNYAGSTEIELPLKKGDQVSVLDKKESGWWQGVCRGKVGWFPASYVKPAPSGERQASEKVKPARAAMTGPQRMEEMLKSDTLEATGRNTQPFISDNIACFFFSLPPNLVLFHFLPLSPLSTIPCTEYRAVYPFSSEQKGDLQFSQGDCVFVYWAHDNGWWFGSSGSAQGWFPGTYVEVSTSNRCTYMYMYMCMYMYLLLLVNILFASPLELEALQHHLYTSQKEQLIIRELQKKLLSRSQLDCSPSLWQMKSWLL